jgi:hypothetical protein
MNRRLFPILSAPSLMLCMATTAVSVRSYYVQDDWQFQRLIQRHAPEADRGDSDHYFEVNLCANRGKLRLIWDDQFPSSYDQTLPRWEHSTFPSSPSPPGGPLWNRLGFDYYLSPHQFEGATSPHQRGSSSC